MQQAKTVIDVVKLYGNQRTMAEKLGVTEGAVSHWVAAETVPPKQAIKIERHFGPHLVRAVDISDAED